MKHYTTGDHLQVAPELRRFVLVSNFSGEEHIVTDAQLRSAFKEEYDKVSSNRHHAWIVYEYFD